MAPSYSRTRQLCDLLLRLGAARPTTDPWQATDLSRAEFHCHDPEPE